MDLQQRVYANPAVVARRVGAETVLVHLETNRIYGLNETAGRLWELTQAGVAPELIPSRLQGEYQVDESELRREVETTLEQLIQNDLVRRA